MKFVVFIAALFGISSAALAVDKESALKIETYPIVADSICNPKNCEDFFERARVARERSGSEGRNRFTDSMFVYFEFEYDYSARRVTWKATAHDGVAWTIYEQPDTRRDSLFSFISDYSLFRGDSLVYRFRAVDSRFGKPGYRGAGFYGNSWFLCYWYAHIVNTPEKGHQIDSSAVHLVIDGVDLNTTYGYQNCYLYSCLDGKLFYIFDRDGKAGWCYNGVETPAQFDRTFNEPGSDPVAVGFRVHIYKDWFDFLALRDGMWYYVVGSLERPLPDEQNK